MKQYFFASAFLLISLTLSAQEKKWTLQECVNHALENNITVKQTELDASIAEENIITAKANFLPTVSASASQNFNFGSFIGNDGSRISRDTRGNSFGLNSGITIFNGFQNINFYKQAKLGLKSSQLQLDILKDNISLNVVNAYLNILLNKETLKLAEEQVEISQKSLNQVQGFVDAGVRAKADLLESQSQLAADGERLVNAQNSVILSLLNLSQIIQVSKEGFDVESILIDLTDTVLIYNSTNEILSYALTNRPEIKNAELNVKNAEFNVAIAKSSYYPTLTFGAGLGTSYQHIQGQDDVIPIFDQNTGTLIELRSNGFGKQLENNLGYNFGLNLSIPIFSGFRNDANVKRSKINKEKSNLALDLEKQTLTTNIEQAYADAKASLKQYEASKTSVIAQEEAFKNAQEKYDLGVSTSFELEQVRNRLVNAQSSFLNAKYNFVFKTKVLDFYMGKSLTD
ncbi:TolC family protein [Flavivirga spongiicola]|uniref:TolC family protein n=1 Tax=Flavivirga spongiicola TaxID=421621 RepID=A0ABU7XUL9_9FLAO|nr:TolC family protein [Flavivirga sp. MEBiC05379]MDO5979454.1 TolC family protein [Flavivirga sp. MEBiC05379]